MAKRRILMKLSGELLCGPEGTGVDPDLAQELAQQIKRGLAENDVELAVVLGGGNLLRGSELSGKAIDRVTADQMGMLATVMNAIAVRAALESVGVEARTLSAVHVHDIAEPLLTRRARRHLEKGRVVLLAGGTGHPFFTTDTNAALRALELGATLVAKGTKVRGVFSDDPVSNPKATFYEKLTFAEALGKRLKVMDATAISLCMDHQLRIQVFNMWEKGNIERVLAGERIGTTVE